MATLADRHHCTERYLQRLFEAEGTTFTAYVQEQRLLRACRLLVDPRRAREKISAVAYDCGFGDVSYFNRVFRRRYGAAPSEFRAQAEQDGFDPSDARATTFYDILIEQRRRNAPLEAAPSTRFSIAFDPRADALR